MFKYAKLSSDEVTKLSIMVEHLQNMHPDKAGKDAK